MIPELAGSWLSEPHPDRPLLVVGPSLGTSSTALWTQCAQLLEGYSVLAWDLPGHGHSAPAGDAFSIGELARAVLALVDATPGHAGGRFGYAGDSVAGAVGLSLLLEHPERIGSTTLLCTAARIGTAAGWRERAELVRARGTAVMVEPSAQRWFAAGFLDREPERAGALLQSLRETDAASYAFVCDALADFDVRDRLGEIRVPVLAVAGAQDQAIPVADMQALAGGVPNARLVVLDAVGHLAPAEAPQAVARAMLGGAATVEQVRDAGLAVRRAVLGDAHVDRAQAAATDLTRDFQDFITQYAWGTVWTRPGLDRRSRSMITLTALVALGHHEELAMHVRAARTNGLRVEEIKEVLLQSAIYCGVPAANTAFRIANQVLAEMAADDDQGDG